MSDMGSLSFVAALGILLVSASLGLHVVSNNVFLNSVISSSARLEASSDSPQSTPAFTEDSSTIVYDDSTDSGFQTQSTTWDDEEAFVRETTTEDANGNEEEIGLGNQNQRPNVILIIADDLGFNDVSFHGSPQIPTPNLDALAFSGVIFNSYYVSPICTPSRTALFSGRHPIHTGMQHNVIFGTTPYGFPLEHKLLPEYLKDIGYSTHLIGKWHLGHFKRKYTPTCRGFDSFYGHWTGHKDYYDNMAQESGPQAWGYDMRRGLETTYENFGVYTTDLYTDEANSIIRSHNKSKPLFLTVSHTAVHSANPYKLLQAPKANIDNFSKIQNMQRRIYAAMVQKLDDSVGSVVKTLQDEGMLNNSIIIFTTDNGGPAEGFNGNAASNWPLRGVKNTLWEGGTRAVGLMWSPLISAAGHVSNQLIHIQDWLPTILSAVGDDPSKAAGIDGIDMWDSIRLGLKSPRTELLHNIDDLYGNEAVRVGRWKLLHGTTYNGQWDGWYGPSGRPNSKNTTLISPETVYNLASQSRAGQAVQDLKLFPTQSKITEVLQLSNVQCNDTMQLRKRKMSCSLIKGEYCLYNIEQDPCEFNNLAHDMPDMVETLKSTLKKYRSSAVPVRNKPKDPKGLPIHWNYTWTNWVDLMEEDNTRLEC
ncbi:Arylsulfatase J [Orchesella cincta]|uniref:Arylsulfatase J n=1 Tax=Orchesella cincta TaxID=48709 RepID=A0A1D2NAW8_ORCCI|nr:Arylsulfatase J [Orchesella cincta]